MQAATRSHYGDPDLGCRADEDTLLAGTGRVCAPRIAIGAPPIPIGAAASVEEERLPVPQCKLGGVHRDAHNGCPVRTRPQPAQPSRAPSPAVSLPKPRSARCGSRTVRRRRWTTARPREALGPSASPRAM
eukprot:6535040-Prymnesium_polylepis.2